MYFVTIERKKEKKKYQQIFACSYDVQELYRLPPSVTSLSNN